VSERERVREREREFDDSRRRRKREGGEEEEGRRRPEGRCARLGAGPPAARRAGARQRPGGGAAAPAALGHGGLAASVGQAARLDQREMEKETVRYREREIDVKNGEGERGEDIKGKREKWR